MLNGCITALVTPLNANGQVDFESLTHLVEFQIENKITGLVLLGTTGEATALANSEKLGVVNHVLKINNGRVKIIVSIGAASTQGVLDNIKLFAEIAGIDYLMCVTPYYVKPTQDGLYQHFATVAQATKLPVILYNVPSRTATDLSDHTVLQLARDFSNIVALKDATGTIKRCSYLVANRAKGFALLSGDDGSMLSFMLAGGDGVISVVSNVYPKEVVELCTLALTDNYKSARMIYRRIEPLCNALLCESNPIPIKWALFYQRTIACAAVRLPLTELTISNQLKVKEAFAEL